MLEDDVYNRSGGELDVEVLVEDLWLPAMGVDLRILDANSELKRVKGVRVRDLTTLEEEAKRESEKNK